MGSEMCIRDRYEGKVITEIETELATVENIGLAMAGINE